MTYGREQMREYMTQYRAAKRQQAREALGNQCVRCGATENLEFHHRDPNDKTDTIANMITAAKEDFEREIEKCELLCRDCHIEATRPVLKKRVFTREHRAKIGASVRLAWQKPEMRRKRREAVEKRRHSGTES